ncbi:GGDEF domain-containing protein [Telluria beijingensis]|uniref:GGDEF domain-containing protein n=1 Tax=Telluria beijingensis TaxID=3068633 RepID=UPI002795EE76|nr:GGDEF domain-containing protein [Massilia sp. REN29]
MLATQQIFLIASLLCFLVFLALLAAGSEKLRGMRAMLASTVLGLAGNLLYAFGRELPPLLAYEVANMAYAGAGAALAAGYRQLAGLPVRLAPLALLVAAVGALIALFHYQVDSFLARSAVASLFQAAVCADIARSVLVRHSALPPLDAVRRFVLLMCGLVAGGHAVRMAWLLLAAEPPGSLLQPSVASLAILTAAALALPALTLGGLLTMHRYIVHRAEYIANHDHLTGAWSRKAFFDIAERELARSRRNGQPLALMLIDLDHFKEINDGGGHEAGDVALRLVAERARASLRAADCMARLGGDEFAVLLPETTLAQACAVGEKLQAGLRPLAAGLQRHAGQSPLTLSIGVTATQDDEPFKATLARADAALYAAKSAGRDKVIAIAPQLQAARLRHTG